MSASSPPEVGQHGVGTAAGQRCSSSLVCILGAAFQQEAGEVIEPTYLPSHGAHSSALPVTQYLKRVFCVFSLVF